ncbi:MAG: AAA family ATPase [Prolixibacteraceae bacterium]|nr:AAA family ATPase [Prolixibacteraceae bacterium]MBT6999155.1 AAA family ATPase [Prolixibacteraceae bacterium]MBT7395968.1 AAA family ATPase [Prolixibacteraceae bacterium]
MSVLEKNINVKGYEIVKPLVKNEQHEILLARRISDDLQVVLKQSLFHDENSQKKSKAGHEYDLLKTLDHKNIPKVFGVLYDGTKYSLVQEYIEGTNLKEYNFKNKLSTLEVLNIFIQLADILDYIHLEGIIHKDINPGNIMIAKNGDIKLLDFDISSNLNSETNKILNVDQIEGTLNYISPEQTGRTAYATTHTCDFYSCGVLFYELLAGKLPFDSVDPLEIIHFHLTRKPLPISTILPQIPNGIEQVISKLTEKNPDDRYQSAIGLKADLEIIKKHCVSNKTLNNFKPGIKDFTGQYKQNQRLYGREKERSELLGYYNNLARLKSMLVLVAGYSGIGKSALIRHVKFPIIQNKGTFISGKFDQFKKDIPYYAFIEAIQEFIKNLLSEPDEKINYWKQRITLILGDNAGIITEVVPQLEKIIDKQLAAPKLQPAEQEARFNMVLLDFIYAFSTTESPLVIFLDDLQWADLSSLNLMKRIIENPRQDSILILGAFRDNEVERGHPLLITLKQISSTDNYVKTIQLKPLDKETTCKITADSFAMSAEKANELGQSVYTKTKGNPFFIHSFLKSLFDKRLIIRNTSGKWEWDKQEIDKLEYTDNVIDLMTEGLTVLPTHTQEILKFAAVLGNRFKLADLSDVTKKSQSDVFNFLKPAIRENYINSLDKGYRSLALSSINKHDVLEQQLTAETAQFSFTHDKVQQAAYNLISESELAAVHLKIGRLLIQNKTEAQLNEGIFELLNHFAIGVHLIKERDEKTTITQLCLIAGIKAKDSTSYSLSVRFLEIGKNLLGANNWNENYKLTYNTLIELGECEYLNDNPVKAEQIFEEILKHSKTKFEKLKVFYLHSSLYLKMGNTTESLRLGLEAVKLYNIHFPKNKNSIQVKTLFTMFKYLILFSTKYKNQESLFRLKDCDDEELIALNKFLIDLATSAYQQDQNLMMLVIFRIIKNYLKYGFTDASGWGFSGFSVVVLSALKMQKRGFKLWDLTTKLHNKTHSPLIKWRLNYTVLCFSNPWKVPFRSGFQSILETIKACVLNGDQIFTGYSVALYHRARFISGENLKQILDGSEDQLPLIQNGKGGFDFFEGFYQLTKALNGQTGDDNWNNNLFNEQATVQRLTNEGNKTKLAFFHSAQSIQHYFFGNYKEALKVSENSLKYSDNILGDLVEALQAFFTSLSISAYYSELEKKDQKKYLKIFRKHLKSMELWAKGCPENYIQHYYLLKAELLLIENKLDEARRFYEKSIEIANQNNFKYVEAIASERAALLCNKTQLFKQGKIYLNDAWEAYKSWGAIIKCNQLESNFPSLKSSKTLRQLTQQVSSDSTTSSKNALDLASVMKASQSIASQVKYNDLLQRLMHIAIENAGAKRGCLLLRKGNNLCLEAEGISGKSDIKLYPSVLVSETDLIPKSFINYCWRSGESFVVDDANDEDQFNSELYFKANKSVSVMCLPITSQGRINGLLYLENNLLKGVFNKNRIKILEMLSGQIGISIENSILYENLEDKVLERTKEIEKQKIQLQHEKEKSDSLLLNILPKRTAEELKRTGNYQAQSYKNVTVMFCDIVGFTNLGEKLDAKTLVTELHEFFSGVDDIVSKYGIEKIKTIGDAYLCAAGLDDFDDGESAVNIVIAAFEIIEFTQKLNVQKEAENRQPFQLRIGMHSGPVSAGVVGKSKFAYDIWGDTVNTAARIETGSEPGKINISGDTYSLVNGKFDCHYRGKITAKNKGDVDMYFVNQSKLF